MVKDQLHKKIMSLEKKNSNAEYALAVLRNDKKIKREIYSILPGGDRLPFRLGEEGVYEICKTIDSYQVRFLNGMTVEIPDPILIIYDDTSIDEEDIADKIIEELI